MKIILSRKGFDKGCGGCPSPYIVDEGNLFSFPIPNNDSFYSYKDLKYNNELSCYDLMEQLKISSRNCKAHTDPDIRKELFYKSEKNWKPVFGQQGNPQKHLRNQNVGKGDLFLFYGLFQDVKKIHGRYQFIPGTTKQIIWGYMEIGENPFKINSNPESRLHPHYYSYSTYLEKDENTAYLAPDFLSFAPNKKGYGVFNFKKNLVLSKNEGDRCEIYDIFSLPKHFYEHRMTGNSNEKRWHLKEDKCIVEICSRGQEFVIGDNYNAIDWAKSLILG